MYQLWILDDDTIFWKIGPQMTQADADKWLAILMGHFGPVVMARQI